MMGLKEHHGVCPLCGQEKVRFRPGTIAFKAEVVVTMPFGKEVRVEAVNPTPLELMLRELRYRLAHTESPGARVAAIKHMIEEALDKQKWWAVGRTGRLIERMFEEGILPLDENHGERSGSM